jgi:hypothetical protein
LSQPSGKQTLLVGIPPQYHLISNHIICIYMKIEII